MSAPLITREKLIEMYAAYPGALETEVRRVFTYAATDEDRVQHNDALSHFMRLVPTKQGLLWHNVAQAIIETAMQEPTGGPKDG